MKRGQQDITEKMEEAEDNKRKKNDPSNYDNKDHTSSIHQAILESDFEVIDDLLKKGEKLCSENEGHNCFHLALHNWEIVKKLLNYDPTGALSRGPDDLFLYSHYPEHFRFLFDLGATFSNCDMCLLQAVKQKYHPEMIQKIINLGVNLDKKDEYGLNALLQSIIYGNLTIAKKLISAGADFNAVNSNGTTVLMYAIFYTSSVDFVESLLKLGADVLAQNKSGDTALMFACKKNNLNLIKLLLKYDATISIKNLNYESPLMVATGNGSPEVIKILLDAGADVNDKDNNNETALFKVQNEESFHLLLQAGANLLDINKNRDTLLILLIRHKPRLLGCMKLLLEAGVNPSCCDKNGNTPLIEACNYWHSEYLDVVNLLLEKHASLSVQNKNGVCALRCAISRRHVEIIKLLLSAGANPSSQDKNGTSLVMRICDFQMEEMDILNILLEAGASISVQDKTGQTALNIAVKNGHTNFMKRLLQVGTNPSFQDKDGNSVLMQVCGLAEENLEYVHILINAGANVSAQNNVGLTALMTAVNKEHYDTINVLLENGANINAQDKCGKNVLMMSFSDEEENIELVKLLLKFDISVSAQNEDGYTALMLATEYGHYEIVKLLVDAGTSLVTQDSEGNTVLMKACQSGHIEIVKFLLKTQVFYIAEQNNTGETAVIVASTNNNLDIVCLLLEIGADAVTQDKMEKSVISYVMANRVNDEIHTDFELALRNLVDCCIGYDELSLLHEVVREYLNLCHPDNGGICFFLFEEFIAQIIEKAANKFEYSDISKRIVSLHELLMVAIKNNDCFDDAHQIFNMIMRSPFKDVNWFGSLSTECIARLIPFQDLLQTNKIPCQTVSLVIDSFFSQTDYDFDSASCHILDSSLQNLYDNGFLVNPEHPQAISPLSALMCLHTNFDSEQEQYILNIVKDFLARRVKKYQQIIIFKDDYLNLLRQELQLPDVVWLAFQNGYNSTILPLLLPYWSAPPLTLLMFTPAISFFEQEDFPLTLFIKVLTQTFSTLLEIGGPLPPGNRFIEPLQDYLDELAELDADGFEVSENFRNEHKIAPPSLKQLCRHVIRGSAQSGDDLPQLLSDLVPPGLKSFLTLQETCYHRDSKID